jgi:glycosyltransferase involved in cell wall biosynthesis
MENSENQVPFVTIIIPVHNEQANIKPLYSELLVALPRSFLSVQIIFVDDGSGDGSWQEITNLMKADSRVYGIHFRGRRGKSVALDAGFKNAAGAYVVTLDGDLQDDPAEIVKLLDIARGGFDLVSGWKIERKDSWFSVKTSWLFNATLNLAHGLKLHDHNCGLKCFRAEVLKEINLFGELHRFLTVLAHWKGFRVTEVAVRHRPRLRGKSKYSPFKGIQGLLDLFTVRIMTRFLDRPFHLLGSVGGLFMLVGFFGLAYLAVYWCLGFGSIGTRPLLSYSGLCFLFGMQVTAVGILAELINWKLSHGTNDAEGKMHHFPESDSSRNGICPPGDMGEIAKRNPSKLE